ncbi:MAG: ATP-binding protein involved in chromosome partitioning [Paraglaciecola sp.]|jgi:ATP-binding protein involved in chromosome partitioning|uniref:iron-sulfur cluster carrier protein ApbC n=1 Tax=uncultured Paraglaciecola sp. TaxID=1765024 RepID=UPI0025E98F45|nr:iron-sulfur cluster carrier protein ApbC [uncultured Paraglaciecola sp.]
MLFGSKTSKNIDESKIVECISRFFELPNTSVKNWIQIKKSTVKVTLPFVAKSLHDELIKQIKISAEDTKLSVSIDTQIASVPTKIAKIPNVKNVIAVASGKGGVGKSTTSVNLAFALMAEGAKVGLLDADIYGPSIPIMLGNPTAKPSSKDNKKVEPLSAHGVVASSIGYFVPAEDATVWRGPMASKALHQLINETAWPELDYLIVDMPPGTGDIQLTMAQQVPLSGAVVVTTPQDLALADAIKGIAMFKKVNIPVLGLVENMSYHLCSQCGHKEAIFSELGGDKLSEMYNLPLLGKLPLNIDIRQHADTGKPLQVSNPEHSLSEAYRQLARQTAKYCYLKSVQVA